MARADFLHPDFVAEPYWWEAYRPASGELAEVPREARVAIVGGGYAGLADRARTGAARGRGGRARSAARSGSAPARATAARSAAASMSARALPARAAEVDAGAGRPAAVRRLGRVLADRAADRGGTDRLLLAEARPVCRRLDAEALRGAGKAPAEASTTRRSPAPTWCRASASARRSPATIITAGWSSSARPACIRRSITRACSTPAAAATSRSAPRPRSSRSPRNGAGWRVETSRGAVIGRRCRDRDQRLYRRDHPGAAPPRRADRQPHHRDRGICRATSPDR